MTSNQMMVHHVRIQHLYSCDGTCTNNDLCRRPPSLVAFHICYLLDRASIYEMSTLMTRFQCIIRYLHPLWRPCLLYIVCTRCIHSIWRAYFTIYCTWQLPLMKYVYCAYSWPLYCYVSGTSMYTSYLQSYVEIYHCIIWRSS